MSAAPLKLVPATPAAEPSPTLDGLLRAMTAVERRGRYATRRLARRALVQVAEIVATIGLHLPVRTRRERDYERNTVDPILTALSRATGHCPKCLHRVATWAAPAGLSGLMPCASHRRRGR
jgi:hypothetical protein